MEESEQQIAQVTMLRSLRKVDSQPSFFYLPCDASFFYSSPCPSLVPLSFFVVLLPEVVTLLLFSVGTIPGGG